MANEVLIRQQAQSIYQQAASARYAYTSGLEKVTRELQQQAERYKGGDKAVFVDEIVNQLEIAIIAHRPQCTEPPGECPKEKGMQLVLEQMQQELDELPKLESTPIASSGAVDGTSMVHSTTNRDALNLSLAALHPTIQTTSNRLFADGYYRQAILDAYIALVQAVKEKSQRFDLDGSPLMEKVFSPQNPILKFSYDSGEQQGFMALFRGAVLAIRNPKAHTLVGQADAQRTLEWLSFASVLLRKLDEAEIV